MITKTATEEIDYEYVNSIDQKFDEDFQQLFTERLKANEKFGYELWSALANVNWYNKNDSEQTRCARSYRAAGTLIAVMEGKDKYTKWYCSAPYKTVSGFIASAMAEKGWRYEIEGEELCS